jgi:hypothetical protein
MASILTLDRRRNVIKSALVKKAAVVLFLCSVSEKLSPSLNNDDKGVLINELKGEAL